MINTFQIFQRPSARLEFIYNSFFINMHRIINKKMKGIISIGQDLTGTLKFKFVNCNQNFVEKIN
jgi:hypothetical protein